MCPRAPVFTCSRRSGVTGGGGMGGGGQPGLLPSASSLRCVLLCTAPLCQATDIHSLGYESEEEGETEGGRHRETRSSTHSGTDKLWAFCLSIVSAETHSLLPHSSATQSQRRGEDPYSRFISVFKFGSNICQTFPPPPSSSSFLFFLFFLSPCRSETVWLVNPARPETDSSLYYSTGERDRFADR